MHIYTLLVNIMHAIIKKIYWMDTAINLAMQENVGYKIR